MADSQSPEGLRVFDPTIPPAPPVPQWLLDGADRIARMYCRPGISLYGLLYAAYIDGWQAAHQPVSSTGEEPTDGD